jgi:hypothetical protein
MVNKVFAGLVIAFWAAMMTALLRVEVFPQPGTLETFSTERVLRKIFTNPEPVHLDVYYNREHVGFCKIDVQPSTRDNTFGGASPSGQEADGYLVTSELNVALLTFGIPSRLSLDGGSLFSKKLELKRFRFDTTIGDGRMSTDHAGDGHVSVAGDDRSKKVQLKYSFGDLRGERSFDFNQVKAAGFASAFGMPGLANFTLLAGDPAHSLNASSGDGPRWRPSTTTYLDRLEVAGNAQRVYLIFSRINDQMWTKMWVDESGQVLKVVTSLGLEMRNDLALGLDEHLIHARHRFHRWE